MQVRELLKPYGSFYDPEQFDKVVCWLETYPDAIPYLEISDINKPRNSSSQVIGIRQNQVLIIKPCNGMEM